jgi:hypothetical protein
MSGNRNSRKDSTLVCRIENDDLWKRIIDIVCKLTWAKTIAFRAVYSVSLLRSNVCECKFWAVEKVEHYNVLLAYAYGNEGISEAVNVVIKFGVCPCLVAFWVYDSKLTGIASHIPHITFYPSISAFE